MNSKRAQSHIDFAHDIAKKNPLSNKHVSLLFLGKRVFAYGTNSHKTNPFSSKRKYILNGTHSELNAYQKSKWYSPERMILVNYHFNNKGELKMAKPCSLCEAWVKTIFKEVWYSLPTGEFERL